LSTRTWLGTDYYDLLGVARDATDAEITRAFRAAAKDHHPDRTDDAAARDRFKALSSAYGVLGNPDRRARYDALRAAPTVTVATVATTPAPDANRPLSVRALPQRRHGRWASIGGIVLLVVGAMAGGLVLWLASSGSTHAARGDTAGRDITLGLVAVKLVVVGAVFLVLGNRRRRYP
jgi:curved DNA-binding protein CbpA